MKTHFLLIALSILTCSIAHADDIEPTVKVINNLGDKAVYEMASGGMIGATYGIEKGSDDLFHIGGLDSYDLIYAGQCTGDLSPVPFPTPFGDASLFLSCSQYTQNECGGGNFFDLNNVKQVVINSDASCTISCKDGTGYGPTTANNPSCLGSFPFATSK